MYNNLFYTIGPNISGYRPTILIKFGPPNMVFGAYRADKLSFSPYSACIYPKTCDAMLFQPPSLPISKLRIKHEPSACGSEGR